MRPIALISLVAVIVVAMNIVTNAFSSFILTLDGNGNAPICAPAYCTINAASVLFPAGLLVAFHKLLAGDILGFFLALFTQPQTGGIPFFSLPVISSVFAFTAGIFLLVVGLGIGGSVAVSIIAGFGFNINEQGSREATTFGVGFVIWAVIAPLATGWVNAIDSAFGIGTGDIIFLIFGAIFVYGLYWQSMTQI